MSVIHYQPWGLVQQVRRDMNRMMAEDNSTPQSDWQPSVDINEQKEAFVIHADLPGLSPADIDIHADKGVLTIQGKRKGVSAEEQNGYHRIERTSGSFLRRFTLPESADTDHISAKGEHGVLTITIPKQAQIEPRKIAVEG